MYESFVAEHIMWFDCFAYLFFTFVGFIFVSWFFDTRFWNIITDLDDAIQFFGTIFIIFICAWYLLCAIFGWEYRFYTHLVFGVFIMVVLLCMAVYVIISVIVGLRERVVEQKYRKKRY